MPSAQRREAALVRVRTEKLCREETYTDTEVVCFRRLMPVHLDGSPDPTRAPVFLGETHVLCEAGPVPVQVRLQARTLQEAVAEFPEAVGRALEELFPGGAAPSNLIRFTRS